MEIKDFGITLRLVEFNDAEFILKLRLDSKKSRFISKTSDNLLTQQQWIKDYKQREKEKKEFYFIAENGEGKKFATYRVYDIKPHSLEIGSWIVVPDIEKPFNSIKVDFLVKRFVFETLGYNKLNFDVRKDNKSVIKYHKKYGCQLVGEDELNYYFELSNIEFYKNKTIFERKF